MILLGALSALLNFTKQTPQYDLQIRFPYFICNKDQTVFFALGTKRNGVRTEGGLQGLLTSLRGELGLRQE